MTMKQAAMTPLPEFHLKLIGWEKKERQEWERARWIAWQGWLHAPFVKNGPKTPSALLRFPDEAVDMDSVTPEDCHITPEAEQVLNALYEDFKNRQLDNK